MGFPAQLRATQLARFPGLRVLAWQGHDFYASRGYKLLRGDTTGLSIMWQSVGRYSPAWWRTLSCSARLSSRFFRDGFHALATLTSGDLIAAVPGAIVALPPGETEFRTTHYVSRGTRPLHIAATPGDQLFWGEYFDNSHREEVHIYTSSDRGQRWEVAYTFPRGAVRHVHNIVYDKWDDCLWVLTGDDGAECRILRASCDFSDVEVVKSGNQQARAVALVIMPDALYFSSDTPFETNHIYRLDRRGNLTKVHSVSSSSIYGCRVGDALFFSTMVEPSRVNRSRDVCLFGSPDGASWSQVMRWRKDDWPMGLFQYGNALLPDGDNSTGILAVTTVAVQAGDFEAGLWLVNVV